jgi:hypothetical protein
VKFTPVILTHVPVDRPVVESSSLLEKFASARLTLKPLRRTNPGLIESEEP